MPKHYCSQHYSSISANESKNVRPRDSCGGGGIADATGSLKDEEVHEEPDEHLVESAV